jgi:DNA-binding NtrC family response regulator
VVTKAVLDSEDFTEVVARLKLRYRQIRVLFVSDEPPRELADESMSYEYAFLRKPFRADALARTIRELLGRSFIRLRGSALTRRKWLRFSPPLTPESFRALFAERRP